MNAIFHMVARYRVCFCIFEGSCLHYSFDPTRMFPLFENKIVKYVLANNQTKKAFNYLAIGNLLNIWWEKKSVTILK